MTQFYVTRDYADTTIRLKALDRATGQTATTILTDSNGSLSDWQDGPAPATAGEDGSWTSGNLSASKAHYAEGEFVPFEVVFTGLTGETTYSINVVNTGTDALASSGIVVSDPFADAGSLKVVGDSDRDQDTTSGTLDVGETWTFTATHTLTSAEIDVGSTLTNVALVSDSMVAADSDDTATVTVSQHPNPTISKTEDPPRSVRPDDPLHHRRGQQRQRRSGRRIMPGREHAVSRLTGARLLSALRA